MRFAALFLYETFLQWLRVWTGQMDLKMRRWRMSAAAQVAVLFRKQSGVSIGGSRNADVRPDGALLAPTRRKYSLVDLVRLCDTKAPLPPELVGGERAGRMGREVW